MDISCFYEDPHEGFCFARWLAHHPNYPKNDGCDMDRCYMRKIYIRKKSIPLQLKFDFV